jgi:hypothetical protein
MYGGEILTTKQLFKFYLNENPRMFQTAANQNIKRSITY